MTCYFGGTVLDLDRSFGFLVNDVARLYGRRFSHNGSRLGLTREQCRTLGYLARNEGINQAGLADLLEIRPMTLVRQIDRMEDAGWIERRPDPADRRARRLYLTAKARPILGRIWDVANETAQRRWYGCRRPIAAADRAVAPGARQLVRAGAAAGRRRADRGPRPNGPAVAPAAAARVDGPLPEVEPAVEAGQ